MAADPTPRAAAPAGTRSCPHCGAANPLDLGKKCSACRKSLPPYCFACYAPIADAGARTCEACGRQRWLFGDFADLGCASETGMVVRSHAYMRTRMRDDKVVQEWRCMKCYGEDTVTDPFTHFPDSNPSIPDAPGT